MPRRQTAAAGAWGDLKGGGLSLPCADLPKPDFKPILKVRSNALSANGHAERVS